MKKILTVSILAIIIMMMAITSVNATTNDTLADTLYNMGAKYGMTTGDKVKVQRYLKDYPVTDAEANAVVAKAQEAVDVMEEAGVTNYDQLTQEQKSRVIAIANEAADIIGVTLVIGNNSVKIYKDGVLIETVTNHSGKLAYTGNNNTVLVVSSIAVIALAFVVARKKLANA